MLMESDQLIAVEGSTALSQDSCVQGHVRMVWGALSWSAGHSEQCTCASQEHIVCTDGSPVALPRLLLRADGPFHEPSVLAGCFWRLASHQGAGSSTLPLAVGSCRASLHHSCLNAHSGRGPA